ncbi:hypothetical protein, partial [Pseudoalteromonas sp. TB43-MNA-CIBAN-0091]
GCHAAAIDLLEKGHDVTWWRRDREPHARLRELGVLNVADYRGKRSVPLGDAPGAIRLTDDLAAALRGAQLVVVPLPATSHDALAAQVAP